MRKGKLIIYFSIMVVSLLLLVACGGGTGKKSLKEGEIPELVEEGSNPIQEPEDIVNNFTHLHFVHKYLKDIEVDMLYEVKGEEELDGETMEKIYVRLKYLKEDSPYSEYDFWLRPSGEVVQTFNYESEYTNRENGNKILAEALKNFLEPFEYFDDRYREALQEGYWSVREMEVKNDQVAGHDVKIHSFYGKHDATLDDEAEFNLEILELGDFEITIDSEDTTAFGTNQSFEVKELKIR